MSDDFTAILQAALDRRATEDTESLARARRIREAREAPDRYRMGDPANFIPGQIDNAAKRQRQAPRPGRKARTP